jgi:hypothetical protein
MSPGLDADVAFAEELAEDDRSPSTRKAYRSDLAALEHYLGERGEPVDLPIAPARLSRHRNMEILRGYIGRADEFDGVAQVLRSQRL